MMRRSTWLALACAAAVWLVVGALFWWSVSPARAAKTNIRGIDSGQSGLGGTLTYLTPAGGTQVTPYNTPAVFTSTTPLGTGETQSIAVQADGSATVTLTVSCSYDGSAFWVPTSGATPTANAGGDGKFRVIGVYTPLCARHQFGVSTSTTANVTVTNEVSQ